MTSQLNSTKHLVELMPILKLLQKKMKKERFWTHSMGPVSPRYQNQRHYKRKKKKKERKLQANFTDKHRCKNSQQNISKLNSMTHEKDHIP